LLTRLQPSRVGADFGLELFDWNQIEQAKSLGKAQINLEEIEPFQASELDLPLVTKHGEKGHIKVRLMFQPEIIAKSRKNTSTFSSAGRAMTQIGGLPVHAGKGVITGVKGLFHRDKGSDDDTLEPPEIPAGQASRPIGGNQTLTEGAAFETNGNGNHAPSEPGTLRVTVVEAKDLGSDDIKPYTTIRVADKEHKTKHTGKTATPEW
jgi:Ca2+-dependent lipid-binding protein